MDLLEAHGIVGLDRPSVPVQDRRSTLPLVGVSVRVVQPGTDVDRRALTPLFHTNMTPYGEIQLRTDRRLDITGLSTSGP